MQILLWLVAPLALTALAMVWALWAGRRSTRPEVGLDDEHVSARFAHAIVKPHPRRARSSVRQQPERASGLVVRRPPAPGDR